jgi:putative transposase
MRDRKKNRLEEYDYSEPGAYFVTLCVHNRECRFGEIVERGSERAYVQLNENGKIAKECWEELPKHYADCQLDNFEIMPNHVHGIIIVGNRHACSLQMPSRQYQRLPVIVGAYKSAVSKLIRQAGCAAFQWQKSYFDRIIRNDDELNRIREYIKNNPINWEIDQENPGMMLKKP